MAATQRKTAAEKITNILLSELYPFPNHPFKVRDDDSMRETVESIKEHGVLVPAIARPREEDSYELIAGHRRRRACELAGLEAMPVSWSESWTTMRRPSSWWIQTSSARKFYRANGRWHTR